MPKSSRKPSSPSSSISTGAYKWTFLLVVNAGVLLGIFNNATNANFYNTQSENTYIIGGKNSSKGTTLRGANTTEIVSDALVGNSSNHTLSNQTTTKRRPVLKLEPCPKLGDSQGNQDCLIEKIFKIIGTTNKFYVEYGFNTNEHCSSSGPNTCRLWKNKTAGWTGLLLDGSHSNPEINLHAHYLYSNNIVSILEKYNVPEEPDFYSGDMDSHDYFIMKAVMDSGKFRPRVVTAEYNGNYPLHWYISQIDPTISHPDQLPPPYKFQNCTWGASPASLRYLMEERYGYKIVAVTTHLDLFFIRGDIIDELGFDVPSFETLMRGKGSILLHRVKTNPLFLSKIVDVRVYEETKSYRLANRAIAKTLLEHIKSTNETTIKCLGAITAQQIEEYLADHPPIGGHLDLE